MIGIAGCEPFEAVAKADDFEALVDSLNGSGGNYTVDAGGGAAANQDAQAPAFCSISHDAFPARKITDYFGKSSLTRSRSSFNSFSVAAILPRLNSLSETP